MENEENQLNGFTFFRNYYDFAKNMPEDEAKELVMGIIKYVFEDIEPNFTGLEKAIFENIRIGLDSSKRRARNKNAKKNREEVEDKKPKQNQDETNSKPTRNQLETNNEPADLSMSMSLSMSTKSKSDLEKEGVGGKTFLEKTKNSEIEKAVVDEWNKVGLARVKTLSKTRKDKIRLRVQELGLERVLEAIKRISQSRFLMGDNKQHWTCSFDWLFVNDCNIVKVLEGNYEDHDVGAITSNPFLRSMMNDRKKE